MSAHGAKFRKYDKMNYNFLNFIVLPIELELMDCKVVSTLTWLHVLNYLFVIGAAVSQSNFIARSLVVH